MDQNSESRFNVKKITADVDAIVYIALKVLVAVYIIGIIVKFVAGSLLS